MGCIKKYIQQKCTNSEVIQATYFIYNELNEIETKNLRQLKIDKIFGK